VVQRLSIKLVRKTGLLCHWCCNGYELYLCETKNCVVTVGATAFNYTCAKRRISLSQVEQRISITLLYETELRCHGRSNGFQLDLCEAKNCVFTGWKYGCQLHLLCEAQNCFFTGGATAFNYTCAKNRIALSLMLQRLSITLVLSTELRCHWWVVKGYLGTDRNWTRSSASWCRGDTGGSSSVRLDPLGWGSVLLCRWCVWLASHLLCIRLARDRWS